MKNLTALRDRSIFIYGNVPSSKNSKRIVRNRKKTMLINSEVVMRYKNMTELQYIAGRSKFSQMIKGRERPLQVKFQFVRDTKSLFDFVNMAQIVLDLMTEHGWIADDNYTEILPSFNPEVIIDKMNCGVKITVL